MSTNEFNPIISTAQASRSGTTTPGALSAKEGPATEIISTRLSTANIHLRELTSRLDALADRAFNPLPQAVDGADDSVTPEGAFARIDSQIEDLQANLQWLDQVVNRLESIA